MRIVKCDVCKKTISKGDGVSAGRGLLGLHDLCDACGAPVLEHVRKPHSGSANSDFGLRRFASASKYRGYSSASSSRLGSKSEFSARKRVSGHALKTLRNYKLVE